MAQKQELWQQLGYDSFRDWRLADAKQRRATARKENRSPSCADSDQQPGCNPQINILLDWFESHDDDPYPAPEEKAALAKQVGMNVKPVETCAPPCPIRHSVQLSPRTVTIHVPASLPARAIRRVHKSQEAPLAPSTRLTPVQGADGCARALPSY